jgi:hypothetical protein
VLLVLSAPRQLVVLAGPEHGRTIPLTVIDGIEIRLLAGSSRVLCVHEGHPVSSDFDPLHQADPTGISLL